MRVRYVEIVREIDRLTQLQTETGKHTSKLGSCFFDLNVHLGQFPTAFSSLS